MTEPKPSSSSTVGRSKFNSTTESSSAPATSTSTATAKNAPVVRKTRSKTGCLTCRKRRVKCDETRPVCKNCIKAGRKCDYSMRLSFRSGLSSKLMQQIGNGEQVMDFSARAGTPEPTQAQPPLYVSFPVKEEIPQYPPPPPLSVQAVGTQTPLIMTTPTLVSQLGTEMPVVPQNQTIDTQSLATPLLSTQTTASHIPPSLHAPITQVPPEEPTLDTSISAPVKLEEYEWKFDYEGANDPSASQTSDWIPVNLDEAPMDYTDLLPVQPEPTQVKEEEEDYGDYGFSQKKSRYKKSLQREVLQKDPYRNVTRKQEVFQSNLPPKQSNVAYYMPSAMESPLSNPTAIFLLREYVLRHGQTMSCYDRFNVSPVSIFDNVNHQDYCGMSNFWTFDVPLAALSCDFLLHSILSWSALNVSMVTPDPEARFKMLAVEHYNIALRLLSSELRMGNFKYKPMPTVATCLILSFYETYSGDLGNWVGHMLGAYEIIRESSLSDLSLLSDETVAGIQRLEILYSFLRIDIMHAIIGGTGSFAPWQFWAAIPSRVTSNPAVYANDELLKLFARLCEYVEGENSRKQQNLAEGLENQEESEAFIESKQKWDELKKLFAELQERFSSLLAPLPLTSPPQTTPFGPKANRASVHHDLVASFLYSAEVILTRIDPKVTISGFAGIPITAKKCVQPIIEIVRCVPPSPKEFMEKDVFTTDGTGVALNPGERLNLLCSFTVPMFLGGVQMMKQEQQDFTAKWFEEIYDSTGFKTALVVKYSLLRAWADARKLKTGRSQRTARSPSSSPISPSFSPEAIGSSPASSTSYGSPLLRHEHGTIMAYDGKPVDAMSDSANRVRFARGVLGDVTEKMYQLVLSDDDDDDDNDEQT